MPRQQVKSFPRASGFAVKKVRVDEIISGGRMALCLDTEGQYIQVPMHVRRAKGGWPQVGEVWLLDREFGNWSFAAIMSDAVQPVITAARTGAHPLTIQVLDALLALGLVAEEPEDTQEDYN